MTQPFAPDTSGNITLSATTTTSRVQLSAFTSPGEYRVYNAGTVAVCIRTGDSSVNALTTDMPLAPGALEVLTLRGTHVAGITASGTATVSFTPGDGI